MQEAHRNTKYEYRSAYVKTTADKNSKQIRMLEIQMFKMDYHLREKALFEANHYQEMLEKSWGSLVLEEEKDNSLGTEELDPENKTTEKSSENGVLGQQNEVTIGPEELDEENQKNEE